jgi:hypothetical protein
VHVLGRALQALDEPIAGTMLRAASNMPVMTSSFTALALAPGALNTGHAALGESP